MWENYFLVVRNMLNKTEEIDYSYFCIVRNSKYKFLIKRMDKKEI